MLTCPRVALVLLLAGCGQAPGASTGSDPGGRVPFATAPAVLFLNFDGATITKSTKTSDAATNVSFIGGGVIPAFAVGNQTLRTQIAQIVTQAYQPFNIKIVTARPASGDYQMIMIGGKPSAIGLSGAFPGISPMDCGNANPRDIGFVFADYMASTSTALLGERISQTTAHESGHLQGLPHSGDPCDLMVSPFDSVCSTGFFRSFLDKQMTAPDQGCGSATTNSFKLLLAALGPAQITPPAKDSGAPKLDHASGKKDGSPARHDAGALAGDGPGQPPTTSDAGETGETGENGETSEGGGGGGCWLGPTRQAGSTLIPLLLLPLLWLGLRTRRAGSLRSARR
jgi:hypothetical protein